MNDIPQGYASEDNVRRSLSDIPFNTPRMPSASRRSSGRATPSSPAAPNTPPSYGNDRQESKQSHENGLNAAALDPRNFTPNLHASLVSEILALRREVESKTLSIETLESSLQSARSENETLQDKVTKNARENRAVKKQLDSIEDGTLSAIEGLCKERDQANDAKNELKRRLDESQTKVKTLDAETKRINNVLANEKRHWDNEKVSLVRRMTVAESRLKAFVNEFAGAQAAKTVESQDPTPSQSSESPRRNTARSDESDGQASVRALRKGGHGRGQSSVTTIGTLMRGDAFPKGATLADEINFDDEYDEASDEDTEHDTHKRNLSRSTTTSSDKARRVLGMVTQIETRASKIRSSLDSSRGIERSNSRNQERAARQSIAHPHSVPDPEFADETASDSPQLGGDAQAAGDPPASESGQALDNLASVPSRLSAIGTSVVSASTQTDAEQPAHPSRPPPAVPGAAVPSIMIHNPDGKSQPRSPDGLSDSRAVGCQTDFASWSVPSQSVATQTEGIRIDRRTFNLPPHLLPSALDDTTSTTPLSSNQSDRDPRSYTDTPATSYEDVKSRSDLKDDEENLEEGSWARLKRAFRPSGSSRPSTELQDPRALPELNLSEEDLALPNIPRSSNRNSRNSKPSFDPPTPVPEDEKVGPNPVLASQPLRQTNFVNVYKPNHSHASSVGSAASSSNVSNNKATGPRPPFAVPPRRSSKTRAKRSWKRNVNVSPTRTGRLSPKARAQFGQDPILRKVQSAVTLNTGEAHLFGDAMTARSESPYSPLSPAYPPVPINSAAYRHYRGKSSRSQPFLQSYNLAAPTANTSVTNSLQYSVVDAITATMIGEWMWKYVRKRKSFGVGETADTGKIADARHRRWVWLSPYERTIMWSSKQPTSNAALMGKPGRKLTIQSVLDVKDETPMPKGADRETAFGRSILVLTPARALKFTAPTRERHYLWLNALSFLAHRASNGEPDLHFLPEAAAPAPPPQESKLPSTRDSIRGPLASMRTSMGRRSSRSSGQATPTLAQREGFMHQRQDSDIPDAASAPSVPRVPFHVRKRSVTNPTRTRPAVGGLSLPSPTGPGFSSNASMLSAASSSARGFSQSGTSSFRHNSSRAEVNEAPEWDHIHDIGEEVEPRPSNVSADFGGNTNFFDAGGLVRMQAFVSPGVVVSATPGQTPAQTPGRKQQTQAATQAGQPAHGNGDGSKDSFIGPPPIGLQKPAKSKGLFGRRAAARGEDSKRNLGFFSADEA